uniref:C-type lectin domain-containing protein n=1 Tax=Sinocyclocheilus anshuiensis TaxID=1608454 RepID=A0A671L6P0_9TELE
CLVLLCVLLMTAVIVLCVHIHTKQHKLHRRDKPATNQDHQPHRRKRPATKQEHKLDKRKIWITNQKQQPADLVVFTDGQIYQSSFYFVSSEWKSWNESRRFCTERGNGAHKFVLHPYLFWIGLTDSDVEGRWKWVDGITLTSGFWGTGEPNGQRGENCIASYPSGWYDYPCSNAFKWISAAYPHHSCN